MENRSLKRSAKPVAIWLLVGVLMIVVQIILGGITRLTGSGLSITEWKPLLGFIPPLNEEAWQVAFNKYQQTPQHPFRINRFQIHLFLGIVSPGVGAPARCCFPDPVHRIFSAAAV